MALKIVLPTLVDWDFDTEDCAQEDIPSKMPAVEATLPDSGARQQWPTASPVM